MSARAANPNSASAQFYVALQALPELDGSYAVFGRVVSGGPAVMAELKKVPVVDNGAGEVSKPTVPVTLTDVVSVDLPTNAPPSGSVVIAGIPIQGRTLVARSLLSDADGIPASGQPGALSYYWKANGEMIPGHMEPKKP